MSLTLTGHSGNLLTGSESYTVSHTDQTSLHQVEHPDGNGTQQTDTSTSFNLQEDIYAYQASVLSSVAEVRIHNDAVHTLTQSVRGNQTFALNSDNDDHHNQSTWFDGVHILDHLTHDHTVINVSVDGNSLPVTTTPTHEHTEQTVLFGAATATGDDSYVLEFIGQALQGVLSALPMALLGGFGMGLLAGTWAGAALGLAFWGQMWFGVGQVTWAVGAGYDPNTGQQLSDRERIGALGGFVGGLLGSLGAGKLGRNTGLYLRGLRCGIFTKCFEAGTPIVTTLEGDSKPIEELRPGDYILSKSEYAPDGPMVLRQVLLTYERISPITNVHVEGRIIGTTDEHPFYVRGKGLRMAQELRAGDELLSHTGVWVRVEGVAPSGRIAKVYNVEVEADHTYFVGSREWGFSVWAHNYGPETARAGRPAEDAVSENTGIPVNRGPGRETIPGSGPGGIRIPVLS
jgi:hypothetical protein